MTDGKNPKAAGNNKPSPSGPTTGKHPKAGGDNPKIWPKGGEAPTFGGQN